MRKEKVLKKLEELKSKFINLTLFENIQDRVDEAEDEEESEFQNSSKANLWPPKGLTPKYKDITPKLHSNLKQSEVLHIISAEKENIRNEINQILKQNKFVAQDIEEMFWGINNSKMFWKATVYKDPALNFLNWMNSWISNVSSFVNLDNSFAEEEKLKMKT